MKAINLIRVKWLRLVCLSLVLAVVLQILVGVLSWGQTAIAAAEDSSVPPTIAARAAIAVDVTTGRILYRKNIYDHLPMASTTKLTTALTALSIPGVNLNDTVTVVKSDLVGEASMGLRLNETVTFQDLLWGMLLNSGNDAAETIARYAGSKLPGSGDPVARFVTQMNQFASSKDGLGLQNSHYANPHGLDQNDHYTSAYDLARVGWYVLQNPLLTKIVGTQQAVAAGHSLVNLNGFLKKYPGAIGIKPGQTDNAGLCLVGAAVHNGHTVITVILNDNNFYGDSGALMNYAFALLDGNGVGVGQGGGPMSLGAKGDPSEFIGYPSNGKLLSHDPTSDVSNAATNNNNAFGFGMVVNAQVVSGTPDASVTPGSDNGGSSNQSGQTSTPTTPAKSGGPNLFIILLVLIVIGGILYVVARMGYLGGDSGRDLAYRVDDGVLALSRSLRRLLSQLKPGNNDSDARPAKPYRSQLPPPKSNSSSNSYSPSSEVNYRDRVQGNNRPSSSTPSSYSSSGRFAPTQDSHSQAAPRPSQEYQPNISQPRPQPSAPLRADETGHSDVTATTNSTSAAANPLEGFFDDVAPFEFNESVQTPKTNQADQLGVKPPQPLRSPFNNTTSGSDSQANFTVSSSSLKDNSITRPASRPEPSKTDDYDYSPPAPLSPTSRPSAPIASRSSSNFKPNTTVSGAGGSEGLLKRAQQAIDYAFAGRMQASTDEFRRVIEQDPLFDFGSLDDFDQMPVLGFKSLANAYYNANKTRFATLLLEMAIEKFPNDLELRNMLRTFKREMS